MVQKPFQLRLYLVRKLAGQNRGSERGCFTQVTFLRALAHDRWPESVMDQEGVIGVSAQITGIVGLELALPLIAGVFQQNVAGNQHAGGLAADVAAAYQAAAN